MLIPFFSIRAASEADEFLARLAERANPEEKEGSIEARVTSILADVKKRGLAALVEYTRRFDAPDFSESRFVVPEAELAWAAEAIPTDDRDVILEAADNIRRYSDAVAEGYIGFGYMNRRCGIKYNSVFFRPAAAA